MLWFPSIVVLIFSVTVVLDPREGNGTPLQHSCLESPMDGGAWWAAVHGVTKSRRRLSTFTFTFHFYALGKEMATNSSVLAWRVPGTGSHRVGHDWSDLAAAAAVLGPSLLYPGLTDGGQGRGGQQRARFISFSGWNSGGRPGRNALAVVWADCCLLCKNIETDSWGVCLALVLSLSF